MASILVTVVVDCYNHEPYVEAALASVFAQDWGGAAWELVVVNDGSTDATVARVRKAAPDARLIDQSNQGQAAAFNAALREAKGEIVCFLDGDDVWYPGKIAAVVKAFRDHPEAVFVQHPLQTVDVAGNLLNRPRAFPPEKIGLDDILEGRDVLVGTSGLSVRRSAFEKIAPVPKDLTTCADDYISKQTLCFGSGLTVQEILGGLRIHEKNSFQGMNWRPDKIARYLDMTDRLENYFQERLKTLGRSRTADGRRARLLDRQTKEILLRGWRGERGAAFAAWSELRAELPFSAFVFFKLSTLLIAVASPRIYLSMHGLYGGSPWLPWARMKLVNESL
jgi:glycosyltransferase involved in cell wall biosynthesis